MCPPADVLKVSSFVLPRLNISSDLSLKLEPRPRLCLHKVEQRLNREGGVSGWWAGSCWRSCWKQLASSCCHGLKRN